jgi:hypothetical protein
VLAVPTTSDNPALEARDILNKRNFGNCNGCSRCNLSGTFIGNCQDAVNRFQDGRNYASRVYTIGNMHITSLMETSDQRMTVGACYADWYCNGAYPVKDGRDIKNVFKAGIWQKAGCRACGE